MCYQITPQEHIGLAFVLKECYTTGFNHTFSFQLQKPNPVMGYIEVNLPFRVRFFATKVYHNDSFNWVLVTIRYSSHSTCKFEQNVGFEPRLQIGNLML